MLKGFENLINLNLISNPVSVKGLKFRQKVVYACKKLGKSYFLIHEIYNIYIFYHYTIIIIYFIITNQKINNSIILF